MDIKSGDTGAAKAVEEKLTDISAVQAFMETAELKKNESEAKKKAPAEPAPEPGKEPEVAEEGTDATPEETPAEPEETPEAPKDETELDGLSDEQKARIQKRIDREVRKRKELEDRHAQELEARETELTELRAVAESRDLSAAAAATKMHPLFLAESEEAIDAYLAQVENFEEWAERYRDDGFEGDTARGEKSYTAQQIRDRLADVRYEASRLVPEARQLIAKRKEQDAAARSVYPKLFESGSAEQAAMKTILKISPHLRMLPDYKLRIGDMVAGEAARKAATAKPKAKAQIAPKLPGAPRVATTKTSTMPVKQPQSAGVDMKKWGEKGFSAEALSELL